MATLVTPSAKSHERVTGRWKSDIHAENKKDWAVYYAKLALGTPIPALFTVFLITVFISRAAVEIAAWTTAALVAGYIFADRFSREKEFRFFTLGADLWLMTFFAVALVGLAFSGDALEWLVGLGTLRWIPLAYLFAFGWRLFPGLNRVFLFLCGTAGVVSLYAVAQHFSGFDFLRGVNLEFAPLRGYSYSVVSGFFRHPEILGVILATLLPFPIAAFMLSEGRERPRVAWMALAVALCSLTAILWTYRPGLWLAAILGTTITWILQTQRKLKTLGILAAFLTTLLFAAYGSPWTLTTQVTEDSIGRAAHQRAQINAEKQIWSENPWIGAGMKGASVRATESMDGNVYFHLLAQTGAIGLGLYLMFTLAFLQRVYRTWGEIPKSHHWHRVLTSGGIGGLIAFHASGLYLSTLSDSHALSLYAFILGSLGYLCEQYDSELVPDDQSL